MPKRPNNPRREKVTRLRKAGLTYAEIGRRLGSTKERIRQIVKGVATAKKKATRNDPDALLTTAQVADFLNVHVNTARRWSNKGILEAYRIGPRGDRRLSGETLTNCYGRVSLLPLPNHITMTSRPPINNGVKMLGLCTKVCTVILLHKIADCSIGSVWS